MTGRRRRETPTSSSPPTDGVATGRDLPIIYCERWNDVLEQPFEPMSEAEAHRRHDSGGLYSAVLGDPGAPVAMVEVRLETGHVAVAFFDSRGRNASSYTYRESEGRLFFNSFSARQWDRKGSMRAAEGMYFKQDGHVYVEKTDLRRNRKETYEQWADVGDNWEDIPAFGDYAGVLRRERDIRPLDASPGTDGQPR